MLECNALLVGLVWIPAAALLWKAFSVCAATTRVTREERRDLLNLIERSVEKATALNPMEAARMHAQERNNRMVADNETERAPIPRKIVEEPLQPYSEPDDR